MYRQDRKSCLFIGDIDISYVESDLEALCAPYGTVLAARVQRSKNTHKPLGYGFVTMSTPIEAQLCIDKLDGAVVGDKPIRVSWAERNRVLLVCNLNPETTKEQILEIFEWFGPIHRDQCQEGSLEGVKYMTLPFVNRASAEKCRISMSGYILDNFSLKVVWHQESTLHKAIQACHCGPIAGDDVVSSTSSPRAGPPELSHTDGSRSEASTASLTARTTSRSISDYSPSSVGGSPGELSTRRMPGLRGLPSIHVKFEIADPRVPFSEDVLAHTFRAYGQVTEVTMKQLCTDEVTRRRFGYAYVYFLDEAGALAAVQGTQHGVTVHGLFLSSEISKTMSRQMHQRYAAMRPQVATYPSHASAGDTRYYVPSHSPRAGAVAGHPQYVYAMAPPSAAAPMQLYGVFAPVEYYGTAPAPSGAPPNVGYFDAQR